MKADPRESRARECSVGNRYCSRRHGKDSPDTTVSIPIDILRIASRLIPVRAMKALADEGIDVEEIVRLSEQPEVQGVLVEVEDHTKNERVVVMLE